MILKKGTEYGWWTIVREMPTPEYSNRKFLCRCLCGKKVIIQMGNMRHGKSRSCGCYRTELLVKRLSKHKKTKTSEFRIWVTMKQRCMNPRNKNYSDYGGRGIKIYKKWVNDFMAFYNYIGQRPSQKHSIDRIDNNQGYIPGNIRWATMKEQRRNTRLGIKTVIYKGKEKPIVQWCEELGLKFDVIRHRLKAGWSSESAFSTPYIPGKRRKKNAFGEEHDVIHFKSP